MVPPPTAIMDYDDVTADSDTTAVTVLNHLTVMGVKELRAKSVFKGGIAAAGFSDAFKAKSNENKPHSKDLHHRLNAEALLKKPSPLKSAARFLAIDGMISLGGGLPSSTYFPFDHIGMRVPSKDNYTEELIAKNGTDLKIGKHDATNGKTTYDLSIGLNYGQGTGSPQLIRWVTEHTEIVHNPPYKDWGCIMTVGSTSALEMCMRTFLSIGDVVLTDEYAFSSAVETASGLGHRLIGVSQDSEGMIPARLDEILTNWDPKARGCRKPFLTYLVPTGHNPTGSTQSLKRRKEIYAIAQKHDLILLEDEPYYFLQMPDYKPGGSAPVIPKSHDEFLKSLVPSYLSLDIDGRVIRMDSFSKVIAPGSRCGWVTCNESFVERFMRYQEVSVMCPSGFSQVILFKLLDEHWGHEGYIDWLIHIRKEYTKRRDILLAACEKYLPSEVTSYVPPTAGMFLWINVNAEKHKDFATLKVDGVEEAVFNASIGEKALLCRGKWFVSEPEVEQTKMFMRATYAAAHEDAMIEAIKRFGRAVRQVFELLPLKED